MEAGEGNLEALSRELREELEIEVLSAEEVFRHRHGYLEGAEVELIFFRVGDYRGAVANRAFRQISWAGPEELKSLDFLEGDLPLVDRLVRQGLQW